MSKLLGRASGLLRRSQTQAPVQFHARCLCGEQIEGVRQAEFQIYTCPSCGDSLCIYPQSPLPVPSSQVERTPALRPEETKRRGRQRAAAAAQRPPAPPRPALAERLAPLRRQLTVPRMVLAAVAIVVGSTVWWQVHRAEMNRLREELVPTVRRGMQALEAGDLDDAYRDLGQFVESLRRLGETFPDEARYRQAYAELAIEHDLVDDSLDLALAGASDAPGRVQKMLGGKALVLDAMVEPRSDYGWNIGFVTFCDGKIVRLHPDGLDLFHEIGLREARRLLFGARIQALEREADGNLLLRLEPTSGVLITEHRILESLQLLGDPETSGIAERQKRQIAGNLSGLETAGPE